MNKWLFPENHAKLNLKPFDESGRPHQLMAGLLQTHILLSNISYLSSILTLTSCFFGPAIAQLPTYFPFQPTQKLSSMPAYNERADKEVS